MAYLLRDRKSFFTAVILSIGGRLKKAKLIVIVKIKKKDTSIY